MTTTMSCATITTIKVVHVIARICFKADPKVVYLVRSTDGARQYQTSLFDGRATGCTCDSRKPCYHMVQCEQKERQRTREQRATALIKSVLERGQTVVASERVEARNAASQARRERLVFSLSIVTFFAALEAYAWQQQQEQADLELEVDPWEGLDEEARHAAYLNYELSLGI